MILKLKRIAFNAKERIKSYIDKVSCDNTHYTKMASFVIVGALIPLSVLPVFADQNQSSGFQSNLVLTKDSQIVDLATKTQVITPGSSVQDQIDAQIAAENAAKAAAAAAAAAKKSSSKIVYNDPADFTAIYQAAGAAYGIDWRVLKAVHFVETGMSGSTYKTNPSGATGPMQFLPSTFRRYAVDGNGDGVKDIHNVSDAIFTAAHYLAASGGSSNNYRNALWSYNPSSYYYSKVMTVAGSLGY